MTKLAERITLNWSHIGNVANISSQVSKVTGINKSRLPFCSIDKVSSTHATGLQLLFICANGQSAAWTVDIGSHSNIGLRPIDGNVKVTVPRL